LRSRPSSAHEARRRRGSTRLDENLGLPDSRQPTDWDRDHLSIGTREQQALSAQLDYCRINGTTGLMPRRSFSLGVEDPPHRSLPNFQGVTRSADSCGPGSVVLKLVAGRKLTLGVPLEDPFPTCCEPPCPPFPSVLHATGSEASHQAFADQLVQIPQILTTPTTFPNPHTPALQDPPQSKTGTPHGSP
jgi:hypothetical protein